MNVMIVSQFSLVMWISIVVSLSGLAEGCTRPTYIFLQAQNAFHHKASVNTARMTVHGKSRSSLGAKNFCHLREGLKF